MKVEGIAKIVGMSTERVHHIVHVELSMCELSARWMPRLLDVDKKVKECEFPTIIWSSLTLT